MNVSVQFGATDTSVCAKIGPCSNS